MKIKPPLKKKNSEVFNSKFSLRGRITDKTDKNLMPQMFWKDMSQDNKFLVHTPKNKNLFNLAV